MNTPTSKDLRELRTLMVTAKLIEHGYTADIAAMLAAEIVSGRLVVMNQSLTMH